jgi:hypothetical protein
LKDAARGLAGKHGVKTKKKCCKDERRCKKCPVVWTRLEQAGYAERTGKRTYEVIGLVPKRAMAAARVR